MIDSYKVTEKAMLKFYEGQICDMQVVALFSGVCKVNAAIATQILIDIWSEYRYQCRSSRRNGPKAENI